MLSPGIGQGCHVAAFEHVQASAYQRKSVIGEIIHRRDEVQLSVEAGCYSVLVGRLGAALQMAFELGRPFAVEFDIEVTVNRSISQFAVQEASFADAPVKVRLRRSRARDSVDMTVPIGIPVISPISL